MRTPRDTREQMAERLESVPELPFFISADYNVFKHFLRYLDGCVTNMVH